MRVVLRIVGVVLVLDASITVLLLFLMMVRGPAPDFLEVSLYGVGSILLVVLKTAGGVTAAVLLWQSKQSGRAVAGVVLAYNALFTLIVGILSGATGAAMWGTVALNAALLILVALPAAGDACKMSVPPARARARIKPGARV
jgi:hypothetical protein